MAFEGLNRNTICRFQNGVFSLWVFRESYRKCACFFFSFENSFREFKHAVSDRFEAMYIFFSN